MGQPSHITYRKHTFLSSAAFGVSAVVITIVLSCTAVLLYGVHVASEKSERVVTLAQSAIRGLPEMTKSLPPALADMLDDQRRPDYSSKLAISARVVPEPGLNRGTRTAIEIVNNGREVVSLLSLRIILLDEQGQLVSESLEWAATPVAADGGWRGPIMPGSRRYFVGSRYCPYNADSAGSLDAQVEITELRVWNRPQQEPTPGEPTGSPTTASVPDVPTAPLPERPPALAANHAL
jgi:hypothetical protein